jgi:PAS domain S-box-containing protein
VLALVAAGHSNSEIAARLQLSVGSVASYRHRAMRKLGIGSIHEIVSWAFHNGNVLAEGEEWDAERFLATVRRAPLMVLVADADMRLLDASEAALRELGYSYEELLRLSVPDIVLDREDAEQRYASYRFTGVQHGTIVLRRRDSSAFGASYTATIRHIGDTQHYVSVLVPE